MTELQGLLDDLARSVQHPTGALEEIIALEETMRVVRGRERRRQIGGAAVGLGATAIVVGVLLFAVLGREGEQRRDITPAGPGGLESRAEGAAPDGLIAFVPRTQSQADAAIATMHPDGTRQETLLPYDNPAGLYAGHLGMDWSPDGDWLAFTVGYGSDARIWLARSDGSRLHALAPGMPGGQTSPTWGPDGRQIAFDRNDSIVVVDSDGTQVNSIDPGLGWIGHLDWSPDGRTFALSAEAAGEMTSGEPEGSEDVYTLRANGSGLRNLTAGLLTSAYQPSWSPDSETIVFVGTAGANTSTANQEVFTIGQDRSDLTQLTSDTLTDQQASWSPDGTRIVFASLGAGAAAPVLVTMKADGSETARSSIEGTNPKWGGFPESSGGSSGEE